MDRATFPRFTTHYNYHCHWVFSGTRGKARIPFMCEFRVHRELSYYLKILSKGSPCSSGTVKEKISCSSATSENLSNTGALRKHVSIFSGLRLPGNLSGGRSGERKGRLALGLRLPRPPHPPSSLHWETVVWRGRVGCQSVVCFLQAVEFHLTTWGLFACKIHLKMFSIEGYRED